MKITQINPAKKVYTRVTTSDGSNWIKYTGVFDGVYYEFITQRGSYLFINYKIEVKKHKDGYIIV